MADRMTATLDTEPLYRALSAMPERLRVRTMAACEQTAKSAVREMKSRLARQLGPNATGQTVANIGYQLAYDGEGYVVLTADARNEPTSTRKSARYYQDKHVGLWLEKGTKPGRRRNMARTRPRPFFYASLELEAGSHERRILEAMAGAADDVGLGD